jgi:hypothetical protein
VSLPGKTFAACFKPVTVVCPRGKMSLLRAKRKRKTLKSEEEIAKRFYNERKDQDGFEIKILEKKGLSLYFP